MRPERPTNRPTVARRALAGLIGALGLFAAGPAAAQALGFISQGDQPIFVEADEGIEWHRDAQKYVARGKASAIQGEVSVLAELLTAYYREIPGGGTEIFRIDAEGAVRIASARETATGDKAVYDVTGGVLVITGERVELVTPTDRIVAKDSLEYFVKKQLAVARGDAQATRGNQHLKADVLMAHYRDGGGRQVSDLERVEAIGNVVIVTPEDVVQAQRGDYDPATGIARLAGEVKLTRGDTQLNGEVAEVDLNSGVSRLLGAARVGGGRERVRGLFVPKSKPAPGGG